MTLEKAKALAALGLYVFPCANRDMPEFEIKVKQPLTPNGFRDASCSIREIEEMWDGAEDAWVGVWTGKSGIVVPDIDEHDGSKNGYETLREREVELPHTFSYGTMSGNGRHFIYEGPDVPPGKPFGPGQGVDRQSGGSYIIWYGPVPESRELFAPVPAWVLQNTSEHVDLEKLDAQAWIAQLPDEKPSRIMREAIDRIPKGDFGRNDLFRRALEIAMLHFEGFPGAKQAFQKLAEEWLRDEYDTPQYRKDLLASVARAIALAKSKAAAVGIDTESKPEPVSADADQQVALRPMSWGEIEDTEYDQRWAIEGLLTMTGLGLVTGRAGVGKTSATLQIGASFAVGDEKILCWDVPDPAPRKVLFLSLELNAPSFKRFQTKVSESYDRKLLRKNFFTVPVGEPMLLGEDEKEQNRLRQWVEQVEPQLLIIDSLGEMSRNLQDEETSAELFDFFKHLQNTYELPTLIVHHHRKVTSENAGRSRRLNDMSDVYGSYNVTKQPEVILDIDNQRTSYTDPKAEVVGGEIMMNLLKSRFAPTWKHPVNLRRDQNNHFTLEDVHVITDEEREATTGIFGLGD